MTTATGHLRPRSLPEILDGAVRHYRSRFLSFVVPFLPMAALDVVGGISMIALVSRWMLGDMSEPELPAPATILLWILLFLLYLGVRGAAFLFGWGAAIFQSGGELAGKPVTLFQSWEQTRGRIWPLIGVALLSAFAIGLGFLLLIVPGLYLSVVLLFCTHALLLEGTGVFDALSRSVQLIRDHFWRAVGLLVFLFVVGIALGSLSNVMSELGSWLLDQDDTASRAWIALTAASILVATIVGIVLMPFQAVVLTHLYWDIRVRKEGLDLDMRLQQIGGES